MVGGGVVGGYIPVSFTGHGSQLEDISDSLTLSHPGSNHWHFSRKTNNNPAYKLYTFTHKHTHTHTPQKKTNCARVGFTR